MVSRSANFDYRQTVIGDCGHVCRAWPQYGKLGSPGYEIACDTCTREKYGVTDDVELVVYVTARQAEALDPPKPKPRKKAAPPVICSLCRKKGHRYDACPLMVGQGTLFDG